jgi:hypothetical protein
LVLLLDVVRMEVGELRRHVAQIRARQADDGFQM